MWAKRNIGIYQNDKDNLFRTKSCDVLVAWDYAKFTRTEAKKREYLPELN